ncbi:MAG: methyltransferase domain-containing protein [Sulfuricurvum sp.]|uniref:class I SAM-dependent methyltransferase n=1 Tax=Sulfuricurvum sp. TaxID=2025608 RepID=UPI0027367AE2|nr:methyltransferase domain-containing protein [Sulfuricurvum sp.]MDP3290527.1 methyltransferase domain-containing protein [Sulfuricurvum sp.]
MKKKLINLLLKLAGIIKKNKTYNEGFDTGKLFVNLGCGMHCVKGWLNIDGSLTSLLGTKNEFFNKLLYKLAGSSQYYSFETFNDVIVTKKLSWYNLVDGIPLKSNSADVVFTSHFLEHLSKTNGYRFLEESYRVLKRNGLIRIAVPDLEIAIQKFNNGEIDQTQDLFFYTSEDCDFSAHKYNYTFDTLKEKLEKIGFKDVIKRTYQEGECPDIGYLDVYPDHSLYVEAKK